MSFSIQTNVNSLVAQENLRVNNDFQSRTIQRLTSGYRINSSGDDAAGLAVANQFRSNTAELTQGVRNANDGLSQLQIADGGLSNISQILDRMKTLATQSSSSTFTGNRATLNNEFQTLKTEIDRQAANIGLVTGGQFNNKISVYIGGGAGQTNAGVTFDLSGTSNVVDSAGLGIAASTTIDTGLVGNTSANNTVTTLSATDTTTKFLVGAGAKQTFDVTVGGKTLAHVDVTGNANGLTAQQAVDQLNTNLSQYGITASISSAGKLQFNSNNAFVISANAAITGTNALATVAANDVVTNQGIYNVSSAYTPVAGGTQQLAFTVGGATTTVNLATGSTISDAVAAINAKMNSSGVYAMDDGNGNIALQSANQFSLAETGTAATAGLTLNAGAYNSASLTINAATSTINGDATVQAKLALTAITNAVSNLGTIQGRIGTAENQLGYAINLAQSQISNFSAAESRIRDADIASEAANLTKAQVLQQASLAAMAQANSAPQAVLALLKG